MKFLHPKSISRLILVGFFLVALPLITAFLLLLSLPVLGVVVARSFVATHAKRVD